MIKTKDFKKIEIADQTELRQWLQKHHRQDESVWLVTFKKVIKEKYVSTNEVLDELLCFGWIDGIRRKLDADRTMQLIGPRRQQHWSKTYKDRAAKLIAMGLMHPSGLKSIERSKEQGLWNFLDDVDKLILPKDLKEELKKFDGAFEFFTGINDSSKRFVLRWIKLAKTQKTRNKRIKQITTLSARGEKLPGS